jgi:hypothetical protein
MEALEPLKSISLRNFLPRLIEGVVHFLEIDVRGDVERALRGHSPQW